MTPTIEARFFAKVAPVGEDPVADCWEWTGTRVRGGYGQFWLGRSNRVYAHRWAYEFAVEQIPDGLTIDHLCRNPSCVNWLHLEPVTQRVNNLRGGTPTIVAHRADTCKRGHSLFDAYVIPTTGSRQCLTCQEESRARQKDETNRRRRERYAMRREGRSQ